MNMQRLTIKSQELIEGAQRLASESSNQEITVLHLLKAMLLQEESLMSRKREPNEDYSVFLLPVVSTKYFLPSTPHISSLFLNVPNLRFTFL